MALLLLVPAALSFLFWDRPVSTAVAEGPVAMRRMASRVGDVFNGDHLVLALLVLSLLAALGRARRLLRVLLLLLGSVLVAALSVHLLKMGFGRLRPEAWLDRAEFGFGGWDAPRWRYRYNSFPSGHASAYGALLRGLWLHAPRLALVAAPFLLFFASCRVLTNSHFISDVLFGLLFGALMADSVHGAWSRGRARRANQSDPRR